jgi:hypothetical protein
MAFTYVISTLIGQVRFLIDDTVDSGHKFEDEEIQVFLDLYSNSIFYAGAACLERLATRFATTSQTVKIGDYQYGSSTAAQQYREMAERLRAMEDEYPAFAVAEENLSSFNELTIIRNFVLRNEGF